MKKTIGYFWFDKKHKYTIFRNFKEGCIIIGNKTYGNFFKLHMGDNLNQKWLTIIAYTTKNNYNPSIYKMKPAEDDLKEMLEEYLHLKFKHLKGYEIHEHSFKPLIDEYLAEQL